MKHLIRESPWSFSPVNRAHCSVLSPQSSYWIAGVGDDQHFGECCFMLVDIIRHQLSHRLPYARRRYIFT